jgi:hypothetical protein
VLAMVRNTGELALDMSRSLRLSAGPAGLSAGPFAPTFGTTLAIADTEPVTIQLENQLFAAPWDATVTLQSGLIQHTAYATITFPSVGASPPVSAHSLHRSGNSSHLSGWSLCCLVSQCSSSKLRRLGDEAAVACTGGNRRKWRQ